MATRGGFVENLGKIYGTYAGGFLGFVILMGILEYAGVPNRVIGYLFIGFTIAIYAIIGIISRTTEISEYYVAGRRVPAFYNGMATGADWMSAASFISMAGTLYVLGYDGLGYVLGWTGGYVLVAVLLAPYLRKFGIFTVPDFMGARYGGHLPRLLGIIVLFSASFTYLVAQTVGVGIITSRFLQIPFEVAVFVGLAGILVCSMLGGMRAVTWTQVAQYIVLIIAYILPVAILSAQLYGLPLPQLTYGQALQEIARLEQELGITKPHVAPFVQADALNFFALVFCLMIGTASLPHILMRYFTTPTVRAARWSVGWSLFFIFLLYFTAPAYAAFAKLEVYLAVVGQSIAELPVWVANWGTVGLVSICDAVDAMNTVAGCAVNGNGDGILQLAELRLHPDAIVLATPEIAGLPYVIAGLVAAGGLAAALSTADGLLLAIANALSHDVYYQMIDPKASTTRRLTVARALLVIVAVIGAYLASFQPAVIVAMVAWAFSLAAAGLFVPLVLGIWWKRTTKAGACAGMIVGFGVCLFYLIGTQYGGMELWWGVKNISSAVFGIPLCLIVTIVVSLMTPAPSREMQDLVDSVRIPRGDMPALAAKAIQHDPALR
jgi:cation/acetate symporter